MNVISKVNKVEYIKTTLLSGNRISFAIEGRGTNLIVWVSKGLFYARIDIYNQSSVPLSGDNLKYVNHTCKLTEILNNYSFGHSYSELDTLTTILSSMKERDCRDW